ncbi:MAG TPA: hypothetical protein VF412_05370 [Bdellovibrio sp.]|uniref:hypothetical protein n=1 Tax=Bdellovibrio sp. TaxID=28201 RepID=UPI002EDC09D3
MKTNLVLPIVFSTIFCSHIPAAFAQTKTVKGIAIVHFLPSAKIPSVRPLNNGEIAVFENGNALYKNVSLLNDNYISLECGKCDAKNVANKLKKGQLMGEKIAVAEKHQGTIVHAKTWDKGHGGYTMIFPDKSIIYFQGPAFNKASQITI